jgi:hypothetical protein
MLFQTEAALMPSVGGLPAPPPSRALGEPDELLRQVTGIEAGAGPAPTCRFRVRRGLAEF